MKISIEKTLNRLMVRWFNEGANVNADERAPLPVQCIVGSSACRLC
jgi:hypothetical protein